MGAKSKKKKKKKILRKPKVGKVFLKKGEEIIEWILG